MFNVLVQLAILASVGTIVLETVPALGNYHRVFLVVEALATAIFTVEYLWGWRQSRSWRYPFKVSAIIDLIAILSFLTVHPELQMLRALRMIRWIRVLKLARYTKADEHIIEAFRLVKNELYAFGFFIIILLLLASTGIYYAEVNAQPDKFTSIPHCFWWAIVTLTTVGYGDLYPITPAGKIIAGTTMMLGIFVIAIPTAFWTWAVMEVIQRSKHEVADEPK